jgi:protein YibB
MFYTLTRFIILFVLTAIVIVNEVRGLEDIAYVDMDARQTFVSVERPKHNITLVSAFFDIGRKEWKGFARDTDYYLRSFAHYMELDYRMVVFIDDRYIDAFLKIIENGIYKNKTVIPINREWLENHLYAWQKLERATEIMHSPYYTQLLQNRIRLHHPENIYPEYNAINHAKIDFVNYAIENNLIEDEFICWTDFGYHNSTGDLPRSTLNVNKFNQKKINFCLRNKITQEENDLIHIILHAPEIFTGSFFGGSKQLMRQFQELYHSCLDRLYDINLSDDDQTVYLMCFFKNPSLFQFYLSERRWPKALSYFELEVQE